MKKEQEPAASDQLAQWHSLFSTSDIKKATKAYESLHRQLAAKDELHAAALQVLERHHQKQLAVAVEAAYKEGRDDGFDSVSATDEYNEERWQQSKAKAALATV